MEETRASEVLLHCPPSPDLPDGLGGAGFRVAKNGVMSVPDASEIVIRALAFGAGAGGGAPELPHETKQTCPSSSRGSSRGAGSCPRRTFGVAGGCPELKTSLNVLVGAGGPDLIAFVCYGVVGKGAGPPSYPGVDGVEWGLRGSPRS